MTKTPYKTIFFLLFLVFFCYKTASASVIYTQAPTIPIVEGALTGNSVTRSGSVITSINNILMTLPQTGIDFSFTGSGATGGDRAFAIYPKRIDNAPLTNTDCSRFQILVMRAENSGGGSSSGATLATANTAGDGCVTDATYGYHPLNSFYNTTFSTGVNYFLELTTTNYNLYQVNGSFIQCDTRASCMGASAPVLNATAEITSLNEGQTYTSPMTINGLYFNNDIYDNVFIDYATAENPEIINTLITPIDYTSYTGSFNFSLSLPNDTYLITAGLYDSVYDTYSDRSPAISFIIGDTASPAYVERCNLFINNISTAFINTTFNLGACLGEIGTSLIVPSSAVTNLYIDLIDELGQKPPFGWINGIYNTLPTINITGVTPTFALGEVTPITDTIFTPFRSSLVWLLWFAFAFVLFNRFKDITL